MFNNLKVSTKIWALTGIAITGFIVIFITTVIISAYENEPLSKAEMGNKLAHAQAKLEVYSLMVRRREKDFFLRHDKKYIKLYNDDMTTSISWLETAGNLNNTAQVDKAVNDLKSILERHRQQFNKVSDMWVIAGLTTNDGLYAVMQDTVHYVEDALKSQNIDALTVKMLMMRRHEKDLMLRVALKDKNGEFSNGPKYISRLLERQSEFEQILDESKISASAKNDIREKLNNYVVAFEEYSKIRMQLVKETAILSEIYSETKDPFSVLEKTAAEINEKGIAEAENAASLANMTLFVVIVIFGGLSTIAAYLAIRTIVFPVRRLEKTLVTIAAGNYDCEIPGTEAQDEFGSMARVVATLSESAKERIKLETLAKEEEQARMVEREERIRIEHQEAREKAEQEEVELKKRELRIKKVESLVQNFDENIKLAINELKTSSVQMRSTAGNMVSVADSTDKQASLVISESQKMDDNVTTMASAVNEFSASIEEANSKIVSATSLSRDAVKATQEGAKSIEQLTSTSNAIETVVNMINDIAEQTNLLALNATIEAARAGEAGKGFAVVASEVKSLATQTASATEDIKKQIVSMQTVSNTAVTAIASILNAINTLDDVMLGISTAIEEQEAVTNEIREGVQLAANGTSRVNNEISQVSINAKDTGKSSGEVMNVAGDLENISKTIASEVEAFITDVQTVQKSA